MENSVEVACEELRGKYPMAMEKHMSLNQESFVRLWSCGEWDILMKEVRKRRERHYQNHRDWNGQIKMRTLIPEEFVWSRHLTVIE